MHLSRLIPLLTFCCSVLLTQAGVDGLAVRRMRQMRCPPRTLKGGRVRLRSKGRVAKYVCQAGSQVLGDKYSTCILGNWDTPVPICIKSGCASVTVSHGQVLETYRGALVTVHCDPGYSLVGSQSLYCNGVRWNGTTPMCKELKVSAQKWCDFESEDLCGWTHDTNGDFDWRRHNFATPSGHVGTGPSSDHTLGPGLHGYYMYLETSSPRLENDTARLFSPIFPAANQTSCFIFWYHMFGPTTGTLNVYLHHKETDLLFSQTGNQGDQWLQAVLPLPPMPSSFQIMIEGVRGNGYEGDTAIDDVKLTQGEECISAATSNVEDSSRTEDTDSMSCVNRCASSAADPSWCECTSDCLEKNTCCPDYVQECQSQGTPSAEVNETREPSAEPSQNVTLETEIQTSPSEEVRSSEPKVILSGTTPSLPPMPTASKSVATTTKITTHSSSSPLSSTTEAVMLITRSSALTTNKSKVNDIPTPSTTTLTTLTFNKPTNQPTTIITTPPIPIVPTTLQHPKTTLGIKSQPVDSNTFNKFYQAIVNMTKALSTTSQPVAKSNIPQIQFVTPPPPVIFRRPTFNPMPTLRPRPNMTTIFRIGPKYPFIRTTYPFIHTSTMPIYSKNKTVEVAKSRNDVLHPVWMNRTLPLPTLRPTTTTPTSPRTSRRETGTVVQHHTTTPVTTVAYKWKSKYIKTKVERTVQENFAVHEKQLADQSGSNHIVHVVVMVCGVLLILLAMLATVFMVRRKKINSRHNDDDDLDIRFLASDEMLDFTLARPSPVRETAR